MGTLPQDVRYALRMLGKSPGFTAVAVATLALGIGANTAIFSIVHAALLRPLPYAAPQRLYTLGEVRPQIKELDADASYPHLQHWQRATKTFESLAAYAPDSATVTGTGAPENLRAARCTYNFFTSLGVSPMLGRDFQLGEDKAGGAKVVLLTYPYWKTHFASNPAVSIVLLAGAGLMVRSLNALLRQNPGFDGRNVLTFVVSLPESSYKDDPSFIQFEHRLRQALLKLPGMQETAVVSRLPLTAAGNTIRLVIEGHPKAKGEEDEANMRDVSPDYFALMKIPVLEGRNYGPKDDIKAPPRMVVNQAFVDRYLSGESPLGKRVKFTYSDALQLQEIIGVVANENSEGLDAPVRPIIYNSFEQGPNSAFYVVMRTAQDPESMISAARGALQGIDLQLPMIEPRSMEGVISDSYGVFLRRFPSRLITSLALLALTLAAVGLYGQISFSVAQRTKEIGVRMALGARSGDVMRLIMTRGLALTVGGLLVGTAAALVFTRLLRSPLFGVTAADPWTMGAAVVVLTAVSFAASFIPARRATKVDPMIALRYE